VTRRPSEQFEGSIAVEAGDQGTRNIFGSINVPLSDTVFARVSAYSDNTDGFSRNPITGVNNDESEEVGFRGALRFTPSPNTDIVASVRWSNLENGGNDYYLTNSVTDYRYENPLTFDIFNKREILGGTLSITHDFNGASLTSLSSYTHRSNEVFWDLDYSSLDGVAAVQHDPVETEVVTQELRLASDGEGPFNWLVGVYGAQTTDRLLVIRADLIVGVDFGGAPDVIPDFNNSDSTDTTYAAFGSVSYEFGAFELEAGARLNYNDFEGVNHNLGQSGSFDDTALLPKATLSYRATPDTLIYGLVSRGYEPGRINLVSDSLAPYEPETTINYEIGVKGQAANGAVLYEFAGFYVENEDRQFETQVLDSSNVPLDVTANIGDSRSYGVEGAITLRPTQGLMLNLAASYLNAEYENAVFLLQTYDGNEVPYSPDVTLNASVDYTTPISSSLEFSIRADANYMGEFFWDVPNLAEQEAYTIVNLRLALASLDNGWEFAVRGQNIFDEAYHTEFIYNFNGVDPGDIDNGVCDNCHIARVGQPSLWMASLSYRF
jgi:iron complex outermembrane receptor protein